MLEAARLRILLPLHYNIEGAQDFRVEPDAGLVGAHSADLWQLNILLLQPAPCLLEDGIHNLLGRHTAHAHSSCEAGKSGLMQGLQHGSLSPI